MLRHASLPRTRAGPMRASPAVTPRGAWTVSAARHGEAGVLALVVWLALVMVALAWPGAARAQAQELPRLQGQVTDLTRSQVLAGARARIEAALADLRQSHNIQLFVLFVETTGSRTLTAYADEVAARSSLGGNDALLVVALADRGDAL